MNDCETTSKTERRRFQKRASSSVNAGMFFGDVRGDGNAARRIGLSVKPFVIGKRAWWCERTGKINRLLQTSSFSKLNMVFILSFVSLNSQLKPSHFPPRTNRPLPAALRLRRCRIADASNAAFTLFFFLPFNWVSDGEMTATGNHPSGRARPGRGRRRVDELVGASRK